MLKKMICIILCFAAVTGIIGNVGALYVNAAEDLTAPELVSIEVLDREVTAGQEIKIKIKVREEETGLARAMIQINHVEEDKNAQSPIQVDNYIGTPQYSSGENLIEYTFTLYTRATTLSGEWHIGYLDLYDQKGNLTTFNGSRENNSLTQGMVSNPVVFENLPRIKVNSAGGDQSRPMIHAVSVKTPVVTKPGKLVVELEATMASKLVYAQFNLAKEGMADTYCEMVYAPKQVNGNVYTFEVSIDEVRHVGQWQVTDIRLRDSDGRESIHTNQIVPGYFVDYYNPAERYPTLNFTVAGIQGDETKPKVNSIRVLNDNKVVEKPGILKVEIDITEEDSGVAGVEIYYERVDCADDDVNSRHGQRFYVEGHVDAWIDHVKLDGPLKTGKHILEVPVFSTKPAGTYKATVTMLKDASQNEYTDYICNGPSAEFTVTDEFNYVFEYGITNQNLLDAIENLKEGEVGRIMLSNNKEDNILTKEMLDAIAGQKKTLVCYKDGFQWIFEGKTINAKKTKDLNLTMRIAIIPGKNLSSGKDAVCLSFENNGDLPGPVQFRFKTAFVKEFFGKEDLLHLFHVEAPESGHETDIDYKNSDYKEIPHKDVNFKVVMEEKDAWCYVNLHHNSKYVVSDARIVKYSAPDKPQQNPTPPASQPTGTVPPTTAPGTTVPVITESVPATDPSIGSTTAPITSTATPSGETAPIVEKKPDNAVITVVAIVLGIAIAAVGGVLIYKRYKKK